MNDPQRDWRYRLRGDPARWLLDEGDDPSIAFWFQRDFVGRPEDAPLLENLRNRILFSDTVQALFAAQDGSGFWESPTSLELPRYRATMWSLAFLAELGIPRNCRRARAACEFILQNHLNEDGAFTGLRDLSSSGLLVRSLVYFRYGGDARMIAALDRLGVDASAGNLFALWTFAELRENQYAHHVTQGVERVLTGLADAEFDVFGAFPPFENRDVLLALRVLNMLGRHHDNRCERAWRQVWDRQQDGARWKLDESFEGMLLSSQAGPDRLAKWATLNVLRIVID